MSNFWFPTVTKSPQNFSSILITAIFLVGFIPGRNNRVVAQTVLSCNLVNYGQEINNTAIADYEQPDDSDNKRTIITDPLTVNLFYSRQIIQVTNQGVEDEAGNLVSVLGTIASSLVDLFEQQGLNNEEADAASITAISQWAALSADSTSAEVVVAIKQALIAQLGQERTEIVEELSDSELLTTLAGLQQSSLKSLGLSEAEAIAASQIEIIPQAERTAIEQIQSATQAAANSVVRPEAQAKIIAAQERVETELENIRQGAQTTIAAGTQLRFKFRLDNQSSQEVGIELPNIQTIVENGLTGAGQITEVTYRLTEEPEASQTITSEAAEITIGGNQSLELEILVEVGTVADDSISTIEVDLQSDCGDRQEFQALSILPPITNDDSELIDPRGQISGCAGELLTDYLGFSVGLYDLNPNDPTQSEIGQLTPLTTTELPNDPDNQIPAGIEPNIQNSNPFFLTNSDEGKYSFLFDEETDQLDKGRNFILLVDPGEDSVYDERRVKITIGDRLDRVVEYTATSLDGRPISAQSGDTTVTGEIVLVEDAERVGLNLAVLDLSTNICDAQEITISKTGDRAAAEPGDIVLYRLAIRNLASTPLTNFQITDTLPVGFHLESDSVRGEANAELVTIETTQSDRLVNFTTNLSLAQGEVLNIVYGAQVTPNALRGSGENSAIVNAQRTDNSFTVKDGPAIHDLRLEPGIIQDSGILLGRVFVDKNFDGEQQPGEPGIPNAVIYLEDGNRVITDADGMFSVTNVLPGHHTGVLDLTSIPEYRLAPNLRFSEKNSKSRLVNLAPGGMVRMNFGVTPTAGEGDSPRQTSSKGKSKASDSN
ncbi:DUF11 domain-containing protein [Pleurocapsales cyanobacterium LEGE 10410]|nr:DUF11 domain-containing protein [Pleurocapsales cyanobacterium LEGE 10410]